MLQRRTASNGVTFYASAGLENVGVPHAFSTRLGGISDGPFASLNLGNPSGCPTQDSPANIQKNYTLLQQAIGAEDRTRLYVHQIHGGLVMNADAATFELDTKADAIITTSPNAILSIRIADCVPIVLSDKRGRIVAAVHAGWRGIIAGAISNTIHRMQQAQTGLRRSELLAAIGPCISLGAFEVGPEVLTAFDEAFAERAPIRRGENGKGDVDLRQAARLQLVTAGVPDEQIDSTDRCTFRDAGEFFSHRRENGVTGRMAALIGPIRG